MGRDPSGERLLSNRTVCVRKCDRKTFEGLSDRTDDFGGAPCRTLLFSSFEDVSEALFKVAPSPDLHIPKKRFHPHDFLIPDEHRKELFPATMPVRSI